MKATYTFLTITLLGVFAALGLTALASTSTNTPVYGFTDKTCSSQNYMWFKT